VTTEGNAPGAQLEQALMRGGNALVTSDGNVDEMRAVVMVYKNGSGRGKSAL